MPELKLYTHVKDFLKTAEAFLLENEMSNNLILGNCQNIISQNKDCGDCYFLIVWDNERIAACSIKISSKIILSSGPQEAIEKICHFYKENTISFKGVIGDKHAVEVFIKLYPAKISLSRTTLIQSLEQVNKLALSEGRMELSNMRDLETIKKWLLRFFEEERLRPVKSPDEAEAFVKHLAEQESLFSWVLDEKAVSMAAIIRRTKNAAIIGLVYTPDELRGKAYAKSLTHALSEWILKKGFNQSGLLVYENNEIAKGIYQKIGYKTVSRILDVDFE